MYMLQPCETNCELLLPDRSSLSFDTCQLQKIGFKIKISQEFIHRPVTFHKTSLVYNADISFALFFSNLVRMPGNRFRSLVLYHKHPIDL